MYAHGTYANYKLGNCRCYPCCGAGSEYRMNRSRAIAYGTWQPFVDAEPVRQHVRHLRECGLGLRRISDLARTDNTQLRRLMNGVGQKPPIKRMRPAAAAAILAIEPTLDNLAAKTIVDATGPIRRIQALVTCGWTQRKLADRLTMTQRNFSTLMRGDHVTAAKARAIRALYDDLWNQVPPETTGPERAAAARARNHAKASGWVSPLAWDDDAIDDPTATPDLGEEAPRQVAVLEDYDELIGQGYTPNHAVERLGITRSYVDKARIRIQAKAVAA